MLHAQRRPRSLQLPESRLPSPRPTEAGNLSVCGHFGKGRHRDPEHRPILAVIPGARSVENAWAIIAEVKQRLGGEPRI